MRTSVLSPSPVPSPLKGEGFGYLSLCPRVLLHNGLDITADFFVTAVYGPALGASGNTRGSPYFSIVTPDSLTTRKVAS